jgi:hypothetical protein
VEDFAGRDLQAVDQIRVDGVDVTKSALMILTNSFYFMFTNVLGLCDTAGAFPRYGSTFRVVVIVLSFFLVVIFNKLTFGEYGVRGGYQVASVHAHTAFGELLAYPIGRLVGAFFRRIATWQSQGTATPVSAFTGVEVEPPRTPRRQEHRDYGRQTRSAERAVRASTRKQRPHQYMYPCPYN